MFLPHQVGNYKYPIEITGKKKMVSLCCLIYMLGAMRNDDTMSKIAAAHHKTCILEGKRWLVLLYLQVEPPSRITSSIPLSLGALSLLVSSFWLLLKSPYRSLSFARLLETDVFSLLPSCAGLRR